MTELNCTDKVWKFYFFLCLFYWNLFLYVWFVFWVNAEVNNGIPRIYSLCLQNLSGRYIFAKKCTRSQLFRPFCTVYTNNCSIITTQANFCKVYWKCSFGMVYLPRCLDSSAVSQRNIICATWCAIIKRIQYLKLKHMANKMLRFK